jgi:hypothetical protein
MPVKEYLTAADPYGFGDAMAGTLARVLKREARVRALARQARAEVVARIGGLLAAVTAANSDLRAAVEGVLHSVGFRRHHRGEWRMRRELKRLGAVVDQLKGQLAKPGPMLDYRAPATDAEAVEAFTRARAGDTAAAAQVRALIVARGWVGWIGDLGRQATRQLIDRAAAGDPVWAAGLAEKANALWAELLAQNASVLEELLVRRVVNGWLATHALELELTIRPPADPRSREHLDRALTRAQKRYAEAIRGAGPRPPAEAARGTHAD